MTKKKDKPKLVGFDKDGTPIFVVDGIGTAEDVDYVAEYIKKMNETMEVK